MKKIISILICIQIALFPAFAFADNVGGWSMGNPVAQGASVVYEGSKNIVLNGADYIKKGTAKITPPASGVAKVLARGAAGYALSVAVEQLLGSVDWLLDPANNQIKYTEKGAATGNVNIQGRFYTGTAASACSQDMAFRTQASAPDYVFTFKSISVDSSSSNRIDFTCFYTVSYKGDTPTDSQYTGYINNPVVEEEEKTYPLPGIAEQVISNANAGDTAAQAATTAAAADMVAEAETDSVKARPISQQLEATSTTKPADEAIADKAAEAQGTAKPNEANPQATDLSLEFPAFCGWAPLVCEAAQVVISVKESATGEPDLQEDQTDLPIEEQTLDRDPSSFDTDYIVLGSQCPSFEPYTVEVGPISKTLSMDLSPLCDFAAQVRPAILGMSYLTAAGIVVAAIRET